MKTTLGNVPLRIMDRDVFDQISLKFIRDHPVKIYQPSQNPLYFLKYYKYLKITITAEHTCYKNKNAEKIKLKN